MTTMGLVGVVNELSQRMPPTFCSSSKRSFGHFSASDIAATVCTASATASAVVKGTHESQSAKDNLWPRPRTMIEQ